MPYPVEYLVIKEFRVNHLTNDETKTQFNAHTNADIYLRDSATWNIPIQVIPETIYTVISEKETEKSSKLIAEHYFTLWYPRTLKYHIEEHKTPQERRNFYVRGANQALLEVRQSYGAGNPEFIYFITARSRRASDDTKNIKGFADGHKDYGNMNTFTFYRDESVGSVRALINESKFKNDFISVGRKGKDKARDLPEFK